MKRFQTRAPAPMKASAKQMPNVCSVTGPRWSSGYIGVPSQVAGRTWSPDLAARHRTAGGEVSRPGPLEAQVMPIRVSHLDASDVALMKLGARGISVAEARQLPRNVHQLERNPRAPRSEEDRFILVGRTDGDRALTLVVERT